MKRSIRQDFNHLQTYVHTICTVHMLLSKAGTLFHAKDNHQNISTVCSQINFILRSLNAAGNRNFLSYYKVYHILGVLEKYD